MIPISIDVVKSAISKNSTKITLFNNKLLSNLTTLHADTSFTILQRRYIQSIKNRYKTIITATPDTLLRYKTHFDTLIHPDDVAHKTYKSFRDRILTAMGYEKRRKDFYPDYFSQLAIKTCVYCNAHLAVTIRNNKGQSKAKFQVDHYIPKNKYPGLSVSLYNLYPSCANCNHAKSTNTVGFKLYQPHQPSFNSPFQFTLNPGVKAMFLNTRDINDIKFKFLEPKTTHGNSSFNDTFGIEEIYRTQLDVVEELFLKSEIYTLAYKNTLKKSFPKLLPNDRAIERLLIANYPEESSIHKRPLAKFTIDIAKQVNLIK